MSFVYAVKIKDGLFIGNAEASRDIEFLSNNKISHLINCAALEIPNSLQVYGFRYLSYPWRDSDSTIILDAQDRNVNEFTRFIDRCLQKAEGVLLFSVNGQSRSVVVCISYLMRHYAWRLQSAFDFIHTFHPDMDVRPSFQRQLKAFDQRLSAKSNKKDSRADIFQMTEPIMPDMKLDEIDEEQLVLRNTYMNALLADPSMIEKMRPTSALTKSQRLRWAEPIFRDIMENKRSDPAIAAQKQVRPLTAPAASKVVHFRSDPQDRPQSSHQQHERSHASQEPVSTSSASSLASLASSIVTGATPQAPFSLVSHVHSTSSSYSSASSSSQSTSAPAPSASTSTNYSDHNNNNNSSSSSYSSGTSSSSSAAPVASTASMLHQHNALTSASSSTSSSYSSGASSSSQPNPRPPGLSFASNGSQEDVNDASGSNIQPRPPSSMPSPSGRPTQPQKWAAPRTGGLIKTANPTTMGDDGSSRPPLPSQMINSSQASSAGFSNTPATTSAGPRLVPTASVLQSSGMNGGSASVASSQQGTVAASPSISLLSRVSVPLNSTSASQASSGSADTLPSPSGSGQPSSAAVGVRAPSPVSRLMIRTGTSNPTPAPAAPSPSSASAVGSQMVQPQAGTRILTGSGGFRAPSPVTRQSPTPQTFSFASASGGPSSMSSTSSTGPIGSSAGASSSTGLVSSSAGSSAAGATGMMAPAGQGSTGAGMFVRRNPTPVQVRPTLPSQQRPKSASDSVRKRVTSGGVAYGTASPAMTTMASSTGLRSSMGPEDLQALRRAGSDRPASAPRPATTSSALSGSQSSFGSSFTSSSNYGGYEPPNSPTPLDANGEKKKKKKKAKTKTDDVVSRLFRPTASFLSKTSVTSTAAPTQTFAPSASLRASKS